MRRGFRRLQIGGLAVGAAGAALGGVAEAVFVTASDVIVDDGFAYFLTNNQTGLSNISSSPFAISSASQLVAPFVSEFDGVGGLAWAVDGVGWYDPDGLVDVTSVPGGTKVVVKDDVPPRLLTGASDTIKAKARYLFFDAPFGGLVRLEAIVKNTDVITRFVTLNVRSDPRGSLVTGDEGGVTSGIKDTGDSWYTMSGTAPSVATTFARGDGWKSNGSDTYAVGLSEAGDEMTFSLGPGEKARVVYFAEISDTPTTAGAKATKFNGPFLPAGVLIGMGATARSQTINWAL